MSVILGFLSVIFVIWIVLMLEETFTRTSKRERDLKRHISILKKDIASELKRKQLYELYEDSTAHTIRSTPILDSTAIDRTDYTYISAEDKATYLRSSEWKSKRKLVFARDNYQCQVCGSTANLECHHIRYDKLTCEPLSHLATLCRLCHQSIHNKHGYDRARYYPISQ